MTHHLMAAMPVLTPVIALVALVAYAAFCWRLEKRVQHLEHEIADMRTQLDIKPVSPEVAKRFEAMTKAA